MGTKKTLQGKSQKARWSWRTDIPFVWLVVLAAISVPRVVAHDLELVSLESGLYTALSAAPMLIYFVVAVLRKNKRPLYDFMVLGLLFGVFLAVTHQITWNTVWSDNLPKIGGNLEGELNPTLESIILRFFTFTSSIMTGLVFGAVFAAIAVVARWIRTRSRNSN